MTAITVPTAPAWLDLESIVPRTSCQRAYELVGIIKGGSPSPAEVAEGQALVADMSARLSKAVDELMNAMHVELHGRAESGLYEILDTLTGHGPLAIAVDDYLGL